MNGKPRLPADTVGALEWLDTLGNVPNDEYVDVVQIFADWWMEQTGIMVERGGSVEKALRNRFRLLHVLHFDWLDILPPQFVIRHYDGTPERGKRVIRVSSSTAGLRRWYRRGSGGTLVIQYRANVVNRLRYVRERIGHVIPFPIPSPLFDEVLK